MARRRKRNLPGRLVHRRRYDGNSGEHHKGRGTSKSRNLDFFRLNIIEYKKEDERWTQNGDLSQEMKKSFLLPVLKKWIALIIEYIHFKVGGL